jgi:hypothetical protein
VLLLAAITMISLYRPALVPYWESRLPAVVSELKEGRFREAASAATAQDPPGTVSKRWSRSEPLGEPAPTASPDGPAMEPAPTASPDTADVERGPGDPTGQRPS